MHERRSNASPVASVGSAFIGPYPVTAELGRGAFGRVYLGTHPLTGQQVAVKVFEIARPSSQGDLQREARALTSVNHGNCLRIFDVIDTVETLALVTEYVPGTTLRVLLDAHGALTGPHALQVLWGAIHGLEAVHAAGLVHGDVKPANILVSPDGVSKLIDFGLVGVPGLASPDGSVSGSPAYAAPEQMNYGVRTLQSDIYAFSVTLFEVLCQQRPYRAESQEAMARAHAEEPVPDPRALVPELGPQLAALVMDGMAKDPEQRPRNVREFIRRFEAAAVESYGREWLAIGGLAAVATGAAGGALIASGVTAASSVELGGALGSVSGAAGGIGAGGVSGGGAVVPEVAVSGVLKGGAAVASKATGALASLTVPVKVAAGVMALIVVGGGATLLTTQLTSDDKPAVATVPSSAPSTSHSGDVQTWGSLLVKSESDAAKLPSDFRGFAVSQLDGSEFCGGPATAISYVYYGYQSDIPLQSRDAGYLAYASGAVGYTCPGGSGPERTILVAAKNADGWEWVWTAGNDLTQCYPLAVAAVPKAVMSALPSWVTGWERCAI